MVSAVVVPVPPKMGSKITSEVHLGWGVGEYIAVSRLPCSQAG